MTIVDVHDPRLELQRSADFLRERWGAPPDVAVVAGSGLSILRSIGRQIDAVAYSDLPGFAGSSVAGHGSDLCLLDVASKRVALFTGRVHLYEGHAPHTVAQHAALMSCLGCSSILLTNACGGLHPARSVGDIVLASEVINWTFRTLATGSTDSSVSSAQPSTTLNHLWQRTILDSCSRNGIAIHRGTFAQMMGPSYETRAEIRMLRRLGADTVGMSSALEARWAASQGMSVAIVSLVTNTLTDSVVRSVTHEEVIDASARAQERICEVVQCAISTLPLPV